MPRFVVAFAGLASFVCASAPAGAQGGPAPRASGSEAPVAGAPRATYAGTIEGVVIAVDYRAGTIVVQTGSRRIDVVILPSTNIAGNDTFHTIADIKKGTHVSVYLSRRSGTYVAQIIRLR